MEWIIAAIFLVVFVVAGVSGIDEAVRKRTAWNLWAAGLITDEELKRRIGE